MPHSRAPFPTGPLPTSGALVGHSPLHQSGCIQPFATVLGGSSQSDRIETCAANLTLLLDLAPAAVLGQPLSSLLPHLPSLGTLIREKTVHTFPCQINQRSLLATLVLQPTQWLLQLELVPLGKAPEPLDFSALLRLCTHSALDSLLNDAAGLFRSLLGYQRVMIFRFHPDQHGEVVAESSESGGQHYRHLHFPATDIPSEARALYLRERLRLVSDIAAPSVPLYSALDAPPADSFDLSGLPCRALSADHRRYLTNLGVRATLITSLVVKERLWGLIVCHHDLPYQPHPTLRATAVAFSDLLSAQIASRVAQETSEFQSSFRQALLQLSFRLGEQTDPWQLFEEEADTLLAPIPACGLALFTATRCAVAGHTPPKTALAALLPWLSRQTSVLHPFVSAEQLPPELLAHPDWPAPIAGLLAARIDPDSPSIWIAFFRREWPREVTWAGAPGQSALPPTAHAPSPRTSFSAWTQIQRQRSRPWIDPESDYLRQIALSLRSSSLLQERLTTAAKLRVSEQRRSAMLGAIPDLLFVFDPEGVYLDAHIPADTPATSSKDQLLGRSLRDFVPPAVALEASGAFARLASGASTREHLDYTMDDPVLGPRHFEARLVPSAPGQILCIARDVTRRQLAQQALDEERTLLKIVFEDSLAGYWDTRYDSGQCFYSDSYLRMLGLQQADLPHTPDGWQRFAFPEDLPAALAAFQRHVASRGEIPYRQRIRFRHRDGSTLHIFCSGRVVSWGPSGEPIRAVGCHIDFTSLYEAQESVTRLALVARYTASAVLLTDVERRIQLANEAFTRITGYTELEALGRSPAFLQGAETDPTTVAAIRRALAREERFAGEILNYSKDGRPYWIDLEIIPHRDDVGRLAGFVGIQVDVTDRKLTELALRERDARFAAISRHVPGVIYQYRLSSGGVGRFPFVSDGTERLWGLPPSAIIGIDDALTDRVHPEDLPALQEAIRHSAATLQPAEHTLRYYHPTRGLRHLRSSDSPTREADGSTLWYGYASDVTELINAQQALRDNEALLNNLLQTIPSDIFLKDSSGRLMFVNQSGLRSLGIADLDWHGRTDLELAELRPSFRPIAQACTLSDNAAWTERAVSSGEEIVRNVEGGESTFEIVKVPLFNDDGSRRSMVIIATDVTERRAAAALLDRERRLFSAGPVAVIVWGNSPGWPVNYVSANIESILGYPAETLTHPDFSYVCLIHPDDRPSMEAYSRAHLAARAPYYEASYRLRHASGEYRWFYDFTQPEYDRDQNLVSVRGYIFDQTKLKQAQNDLLQREKQIAIISHHVPGMLYRFALRTDGSACFPYATEGIQKLLGFSHEQVRENAAEVLSHIHVEDQPRFIASIAQSRAALSDWSAEWRIHHPQLGLRWVCGSSSPRVLENGDCVWDGYSFDITDRKAAEENLLREGKREAIERLAGGVAHDFNNYLTSLALAGDLLINDSDLPDRARKIAITICSEVSAAAAVARQLLAFTKDQPIHLESIPLAAFLTDCADFALRGSAMRAEVEVTEPELMIVCDPDLLRQALFNLILNAREASNGKGNIHLSAAARAESITLRVADTGPGIPGDKRSKIFEPYFTTKETGSGLGLFVVRSILLRLGGDIELDPSAPQGACFVIQLPHRPLPAAPTPTQPPFNRPFSTPSALPTTGSDPASTFPTRVLLLEDDQQQTKLLLNFFEALKVSCQVFDSGDALLAAAPAHAAAGQSTLCMLDITIRGARGGLEIAPALRKLLPEARLFLVSGYSADWAANEKSITGLGIVFIPKPYRLKELKRRLFGI